MLEFRLWINHFCSKFRQKLSSIHRRSAFYVFHPSNSAASTRKYATNTATEIRADLGCAAGDTETNANTTDTSTKRQRAAKKQASRQENIAEEECKSATKKPKISSAALLKGNTRDRNRLQEKEDFQLAKLLQEYDSNAHSPTLNRSVRYALRSRSKAPSSLSSSSSSIENFSNKFTLLSTQAAKKTCATEVSRPRRNGESKATILGLNDQKLTRSRRLALTMTGA